MRVTGDLTSRVQQVTLGGILDLTSLVQQAMSKVWLQLMIGDSTNLVAWVEGSVART
jgi:hypothetical protein